MSLATRLLSANPGAQVTTALTGALTTPGAKGAFNDLIGSSSRAIYGLGDATGTLTNVMSYFNIITTGNATYFGDLSQNARHGWATSSTTRALIGGGVRNPNTDSSTMDYVTIASTGNSTSFGTSYASRPRCMATGGNSTRGLMAGAGFAAGTQSTNIEYHTFATTGNGSFFGDLTRKRQYAGGGSSPTRTLIGGGYDVDSGGTTLSGINYLTTATTGNGTNFGDLTVGRESASAAANSTRCIFSYGGNLAGTIQTVVEYLTIATTGNGTDFADLSLSRVSSGMTTNEVRVVIAGGNTSGTSRNVIDFIVIANGGTATDFGDLTQATDGGSMTSSLHGGLQ